MFVPSSLCNPNGYQNQEVSLNNPNNMMQIKAALENLTPYLPNSSLLEYLDEITWTELHVQNGAERLRRFRISGKPGLLVAS